MTNMEKGGEEYCIWAGAICNIMQWDTVNSDINFMNSDGVFEMWEKGDTVKDVISRAKSVDEDHYLNRYNEYIEQQYSICANKIANLLRSRNQ